MKDKTILQGVGLAILATIIWSGNFVVARGIYKEIAPVNISFYRWGFATLILVPFAWKKFVSDWPTIRGRLLYFFSIALFGVSLFNTFVYIAAHYTSAINLALIGTTTSPIMSNILARIFLKEKIGWQKILGLSICIIGILYLLSAGNFQNLARMKFSEGDGWVLLAAFSFAVYNTLVKKKPTNMSAISFLFTTFLFGTLLLLPFFIWESYHTAPVSWNPHLVGVIIYLSLGASVISFLLWNIAIARLGAGRTALFGNLIPVFSSLEAMVFLHEKFTILHAIAFVLVLIGLWIANLELFRRQKA